MRNNPCPNTQQRGVFPLVPTHNKGSVARTWKDKSFSALLDSVWWKCCCHSAAGIPSWSPPKPRSCLQVTSDFTVPGPGGLGDISPSGNLSGPLSATAPGSHWLPCPVRDPKENTPHTSHWDLNAYSRPAPVRCAWSPFPLALPRASCTAPAVGDTICPSPSHSAQRWWHRGRQDPEGWRHSSAHSLPWQARDEACTMFCNQKWLRGPAGTLLSMGVVVLLPG